MLLYYMYIVMYIHIMCISTYIIQCVKYTIIISKYKWIEGWNISKWKIKSLVPIGQRERKGLNWFKRDKDKRLFLPLII